MRSTIAAWVHCRYRRDTVKRLRKKSIGELWMDGKRLDTNNTALIHTHTRARTNMLFKVTTFSYPTHLTLTPDIDT